MQKSYATKVRPGVLAGSVVTAGRETNPLGGAGGVVVVGGVVAGAGAGGAGAVVAGVETAEKLGFFEINSLYAALKCSIY